MISARCDTNPPAADPSGSRRPVVNTSVAHTMSPMLTHAALISLRATYNTTRDMTPCRARDGLKGALVSLRLSVLGELRDHFSNEFVFELELHRQRRSALTRPVSGSHRNLVLACLRKCLS